MKKAHSKEWAFFQTRHSCLAKKAKKKSECVCRGHKGHVSMIHKLIVEWQGVYQKTQKLVANSIPLEPGPINGMK